ncbi:hypothetical protein N9I19_09330 [Peribacillus sp. CSMR9]|nr:hypothetical protein [Peribacillus sp. CSMR9]
MKLVWKVGALAFPERVSHTRSNQLEMFTLDQLVPENHLVRKMEADIYFSFIILHGERHTKVRKVKIIKK